LPDIGGSHFSILMDREPQEYDTNIVKKS